MIIAYCGNPDCLYCGKHSFSESELTVRKLIYTGSPAQLEQLKADIDARAEEVVKKLQEKGIIDKPGQGFIDGFQHAINVIFQEQVNKDRLDKEFFFYNKILDKLQLELKKLEKQNESQ